ncbi:TPA: hypothetical protein ACS72K_003543 [Providencia alcalifaciens]
MDKLDDVRAVFEKLYKEQTVFIENSHGYDSQKFALWAGFQLGWQASRDSLEIKLPDLGDVILDDYFVDGFNDAISEVEKILISNGLKVK